MLVFPDPPPGPPDYIPGPVASFFYFMLGYICQVMCFFFVLPRNSRWARIILRIAFLIPPEEFEEP